MRRRSAFQVWAPLFVVLVSCLLSFRLIRLVDQHAVNVLFWDQWGLYEAFFREASWWETFRWQHGPHRQGVGFLLTRLVADLSGWNVRAEAFAVWGVVCAAAVAALLLGARLFQRIVPADAAIPLLLLTPAQYLIFVHTPNVSHGAMPLLLLVLYCLAWTLHRDGSRLSAVLVLNLLLVHTGFGIVAGVLTPALLAVECLHGFRARGVRGLCWPGLALMIALLSLASFFAGYDFEHVAAHRHTSSPTTFRYWQFVALGFANVCGIKGTGALPSFAGLVALGAAIRIGAHHARRLVVGPEESRAVSAVIVVLIGFTLLFDLGAARGRLVHGVETAQSSRYVPLMVPAFLGMYLHLRTLHRRRTRRVLLAGACAGLVVATFPMRRHEVQFMRVLTADKREWVATYLATESIVAADRAAGRKVYPWQPERVHMSEKLAFMKERGLNLYHGASPGPADWTNQDQ